MPAHPQPLRPRPPVWRIPLLAAALWATAALAHAAPPACPFTPEVLKKTFGVDFATGKEEPGIGTGCIYKTQGGSLKNDTDFSVGVYINASMNDRLRTMTLTAGNKHELVPVPGDADKAVVVRHRGDVPGFPEVAYIRAGHDVTLHVRGGSHDTVAARTARNDAFNRKLLSLPRVP
jgi:hypothetical protein